jgi:hypothetical protein
VGFVFIQSLVKRLSSISNWTNISFTV